MLFSEFSEDSKVWIYQADRFLDATEINWLKEQLTKFISEWNAHGTKLASSGQLLHDRFLVFVVDEKVAAASGCSIDSSVSFVKFVGKELEIDFFNRLKILGEENGEYVEINYSDLSEYSDTQIFNPMVQNLADLRSKWRIPAAETGLI